ncbi:hypothetical protein MRB53_040717 [Persea americana]|nr:hypothetical protein MRB53_040717 [Persea americana]
MASTRRRFGGFQRHNCQETTTQPTSRLRCSGDRILTAGVMVSRWSFMTLSCSGCCCMRNRRMRECTATPSELRGDGLVLTNNRPNDPFRHHSDCHIHLLMTAPRSMSRCSHEALVLQPCARASEAGFVPVSPAKLAAAATPHGRSQSPERDESIEHAFHASQFPAPLVLPDDDLFLDPRQPAQSLLAWSRNQEMNVVSEDRKTIYIAAPPRHCPRCRKDAVVDACKSAKSRAPVNSELS